MSENEAWDRGYIAGIAEMTAERDAAMAQVAVLAEYCHDMVNPSGIVNTTALANDLAHLPAAANRLLAEAAIGRKAIECHSPTQWEGSDHFPGLSDALEAWRQAE